MYSQASLPFIFNLDFYSHFIDLKQVYICSKSYWTTEVVAFRTFFCCHYVSHKNSMLSQISDVAVLDISATTIAEDESNVQKIPDAESKGFPF